MNTPADFISLSAFGLHDFDVLTFGSQSVPSTPVKFGFQVDVSVHPGISEVMFGFMNANEGRVKSAVGFGVRIDLERGEIWDVANDSGLVGWLEEPLGCTEGADGKVLLSLEIERAGSALLPKLQIGGEEWLYPAVRSAEALELLAVAGCKPVHGQSAMAVAAFSSPSVWAERP
ncbi:MAG: hypothetical protein JNJ83_02820 [Verrucomicrobiaceae bacterium]|nr:hypothetical protein [Verrucomicrobiaceae bacterium]